MRKFLKLCRVAKDRRQKDLADELGISVATFCRIEDGTAELRLDQAAKLADALDTPAELLVLNFPKAEK